MEGPPNHFFLDGVLKDMWVGEGEWYTFSKSYLPSILPGTFRNVSIWLHSSRSPGNMIEFTILNYIKRSSLVRTLSHIKASLPLPRGRVPEASSQQRSDMANPSKSWAMMTYSFFSFSLLVQRSLVIVRAGQVDPKPLKSQLPDKKYNFNSFSLSRTSVAWKAQHCRL